VSTWIAARPAVSGASASVRDDWRVSVCVCTRNRPHELRRCLASIAASRLPVHETIVSDDSDDGEQTRAVCGEFERVAYLPGPGRGLCANRNNAVAAATGTHVLFLDDDACLSATFLDAVAARLDALSPQAGASTIVTGRERRPDRVTAARDQSFLGFQERAYADGEPMRTVVINATVFPAPLFARLGFDELLRYGYDEVDLTTRAVALGYRIVAAPDAINDHFPSPTNRDEYRAVVDASRLYVTYKRYRRTDHKPLAAFAYCFVAPVHLLLAVVRRRGPRAAASALAAIGLAAAHVRAGSDGATALPPRPR
jgi:GT2 family glycosyltransferase